jgi:signal transduction histidine kinase
VSLDTFYLPAERAEPGRVSCQADLLADERLLIEVLEALPNMVVVLNEYRQIVFTNGAVRTFAADRTPDLLGARTGEALGCVNARREPGGCGCSEQCRTCGVVAAVVAALDGEAAVGEAGLTLDDGMHLDLEVRGRPVRVDGQQMVVLTLSDIAHLKRRRALERTFFHDVLNTAGGIEGLTGLLETARGEESRQLHDMLATTARQLVGEIESHRLLVAAENDEYVVRREAVVVAEALRHAVAGQAALARTRGVVVQAPARPGHEARIITDPVLLGRILANLCKNAVEAGTEGDRVTLTADVGGDRVSFGVHNPALIPREVLLQLFQRSFSTKGMGRGLGTYSVKLFAESYLGGRVAVTSTPRAGTCFTVTLPRESGGPAIAAD